MNLTYDPDTDEVTVERESRDIVNPTAAQIDAMWDRFWMAMLPLMIQHHARRMAAHEQQAA